MPDPSAPHEDPLGGLFSALPDPPGAAAAAGGTPAGPPTSRRQARAAAGDGRPADAVPAPAASFDDLLAGAAAAPPVDSGWAQPTPRKRRRGRWVALIVVLALVGGGIGAGVYVWNAYGTKVRELLGWEEPNDYTPGMAHGETLVTIASGDTGSAISRSLYAAGVTKTSGVFYEMLVKSKQNPTFYPGVYRLKKQMTAAAALAALKDPANKLAHSALIREGITQAQILPILADSLKIPLADFQAAVAHPAAYGVTADSLEGWLFPAMYTFDPGATATQVIKTMVARTVTSLDKAGVPVADRQRVLTVASIIQREARQSADFYKVSRVISNRLAQGMKLEMDSTAQFGYGQLHNGTVSSSAAALADKNAWNTYVITGLPKGPISSPGDTAIDAAMHPADGPWLYFVTVNLNTGETVFSATYADHQKAVAQWRTWCKANPNTGC